MEQHAKEIASAFFEGVEDSLHGNQILLGVREWVMVVSDLAGDTPDLSRTVARAIVTRSKRTGRSIVEVIEETSQKGPAVLFPWLEKIRKNMWRGSFNEG